MAPIVISVGNVSVVDLDINAEFCQRRLDVSPPDRLYEAPKRTKPGFGHRLNRVSRLCIRP